jgi:uncharacterized protein YukE
MRISREKSYDDLVRGEEQCWKVYHSSLATMEMITQEITDSIAVVVADWCGEEEFGFSSQFIIASCDADDLKKLYKQLKQEVK